MKVTPSSDQINAEFLRNEAGQLLDKHQDDISKRAETMLCKSATDQKLMSSSDQTQQIELELQNEELKRTQQELSASRDDFERIYQLSPVAYLTLTEQGLIKRVNAAATQLLGSPMEGLVNIKLGKFIDSSDQDKFYVFLQDLINLKNNQILNVKLAVKNSTRNRSECQGFSIFGCSRSFCNHNNQFTHVEMRGAVGGNHHDTIQIYLAIQDITEYRHGPKTIACLNEKLEQKIHEQTSALFESNLGLTSKIHEFKYSKQQTACWLHFLVYFAGKEKNDMSNNKLDTLVYLVDDEFEVRDSLVLLNELTVQVIITFNSAEGFLDNYDPKMSGCLLLDFRMPFISGLELQDVLIKRKIDLPIIFINRQAEVTDSAKAFSTDAVDFLIKPFDNQVLPELIVEFINKCFASREQWREHLEINQRIGLLTVREQEVLSLIVRGYSNKEMAKMMNISIRTIETHRANVMKKMQANSVAELILMVMQRDASASCLHKSFN